MTSSTKTKGSPQNSYPGRVGAKPQGLILIAEDEIDIADIMKEALVHIGHEVLVAQNGREAMELYRSTKRKFDLVITDIRMPITNGLELLREIRMNPAPGKHTPVLVVSAFTLLPGIAEQCENLQVDGVVTKPFTPDLLLHQVKKLLFKG